MAAILHRAKSLAWFGLLVVLAEVVGGSLTTHVDRRLHVMPLASSSASYYPFLLVGVKVAAAIGLAALLARITRLRATREAGERLLEAAGHHSTRRLPRLRTTLSPRAWWASFGCTSVAYLVQMNTTRMSDRHLPVFAPWLHACGTTDVRHAGGRRRAHLGSSVLAARRRGIRLRHARSRPPNPLVGAASRAEPFNAGRRAPASPSLRSLARLEASSAHGLTQGRFSRRVAPVRARLEVEEEKCHRMRLVSRSLRPIHGPAPPTWCRCSAR